MNPVRSRRPPRRGRDLDTKHPDKVEDLRRRLLEQQGTLDPAIRRAAAEGGQVPDSLAAYVDKVRRHAYTVTDGDVEGLLTAGWTEDQIFEVTVAAAFGAAKHRLDAALTAMDERIDLEADEARTGA